MTSKVGLKVHKPSFMMLKLFYYILLLHTLNIEPFSPSKFHCARVNAVYI